VLGTTRDCTAAPDGAAYALALLPRLTWRHIRIGLVAVLVAGCFAAALFA
jgi:hypothetical protein